MTATASRELRAAFRPCVEPILRDAGFTGKWPTWNRVDDRGDVATVNVQTSPWTRGADGAYFVNLAVTPRPWLEWWHLREMGSYDPAYCRASAETGFYQARMAPAWAYQPGTYAWVVDDSHPATETADRIGAVLVESGLPQLDHHQDRSRLIDLVRHGRPTSDIRAVGPHLAEVALAVLLTDDGPSDQLRAACAELAAIREPEHARREADLALRWISERLAAQAFGVSP